MRAECDWSTAAERQTICNRPPWRFLLRLLLLLQVLPTTILTTDDCYKYYLQDDGCRLHATTTTAQPAALGVFRNTSDTRSLENCQRL